MSYLCTVLKQVVHIICSFWLALLLLFGNTPKDFMHRFADHHDTIHQSNYGKSGAVADVAHHHCSFLDFHLMPFAEPQQWPFIAFAGCADYLSYATVVATRIHAEEVRHISLRGPPARWSGTTIG